jgi:hypothetical protein
MWVDVMAGDMYSPVTPESVMFLERSDLCSSSMAERATHVTDGVLSDINAVLEDALGTRLARCRCASGSNDLVWGSLDIVLGVVVEEVLILLPVVVLPLLLVVVLLGLVVV